MEKIILLITILTTLSSCSSSFDFEEANKLVELLKEDSRIYRLAIHETTIIINGQKTSTNKAEIDTRIKSGFNYELQLDYLNSIDVSTNILDSMLTQLRNTKAYSVDYKEGKAYFIMDIFLDCSNGYLYSVEDLEMTNADNNSEIRLHGGNIRILEKVNSSWYKVGAWH